MLCTPKQGKYDEKCYVCNLITYKNAQTEKLHFKHVASTERLSAGLFTFPATLPLTGASYTGESLVQAAELLGLSVLFHERCC